jgi:hypothetical protein
VGKHLTGAVIGTTLCVALAVATTIVARAAGQAELKPMPEALPLVLRQQITSILVKTETLVSECPPNAKSVAEIVICGISDQSEEVFRKSVDLAGASLADLSAWTREGAGIFRSFGPIVDGKGYTILVRKLPVPIEKPRFNVIIAVAFASAKPTAD